MKTTLTNIQESHLLLSTDVACRFCGDIINPPHNRQGVTCCAKPECLKKAEAEIVSIKKPLNNIIYRSQERNSQGPPLINKTCKLCGAEIKPTGNWQNVMYYCINPICIQKAKLEYINKHIDDIMAKAQFPIHFRKIVTDQDLSKYSNLRRGLYIHGSVGTGKTIFACGIARQSILETRTVRFFSTIALILSLYDMWRRPEEQIKKFIDDVILTPEIVVLDDLGSEKLTDYVRTTFFYIINEAEMREKLLIITSNFSLDDLDKHLGCRIASRIAGMCDVIKFIGEDKRVPRK